MVQGGMSVVKFLLFAFNFVFVICGIALITVGAIAQSSGNTYTVFLGSKFVTAPIIFITLGCFVFLMAFLGCWGAMRQNYCMVMTFGILLFLIFVIEISGGIAAYVYRNKLEDILHENMLSALQGYKKDAKVAFDEMQTQFPCCGVDGPSDYRNASMKIPDTCCGKIVKTPCPPDEVVQVGCYEKFKEKVIGEATMIGGAGIAIAFIEILGMIFAWCLASAIKKEYEGV